MTQILTNAVYGLHKNTEKLQKAAHNIANVANPNENVQLDKELVETMVAEHGYKANAAVIRTEDEMMGELIDVLS